LGLEIAGQLRKIVEKKQEYQGMRDKMTASLLLAARYSMDILKQIDNYDKLKLKDILALTDEWGPLAVRLSSGKISQDEIVKVKTNVQAYANKIGILTKKNTDEQRNDNVAPVVTPIDN